MLFPALLAAPGDFILSRIDLHAVEQEWSDAKRDHSVDGHPLRIGGKAYDTGIGTHAASLLELRLDGNALRFHAMVGVDDEAKDTGSVRFLVFADDRPRYDSGVMRKGPAKAIDLDLTGAKTLRLVVEDGGDGIDNDHADWADATLSLKDPAKPPTPLMVEPEPTMAIAPVDRVRTTIHGPRAVGGTPGRPFLFRVPATGQGPLRYAYKGLPSGVRARGPVLEGTVPPTGRYPIAVTVSGPKGTDRRTVTLVSGLHKLAQTPPMGWNSWNVWATSVTADKVRAAADSFVKLGLADFGYGYVNIDDAWEAGRDPNGEIQTNDKFGDLPGLAAYVHRLGLKLGIYSSPGPKTCGNYTGSWRHEAQDAATYAKWGVDYLKYDWCSYGQLDKGDTLEGLQKPYRVMREGLDRADRDIVFSLCQYGMGSVWDWGMDPGVDGDLWRTTGDINDSWRSMSSIGFSQSDHGGKIGPGAWNDPDMLVVGRLGWGPAIHPTRLTGNEQITHITLWSMLAAPLLIGCDLTQMDDFTQRVLLNGEVIEIDQDTLGKPARRVHQEGQTEVWTRPLADGSTAVALFNRGPAHTTVAASWSRDLKGAHPKSVRDLWRRCDVKPAPDGLVADVPAHGAVLFRVR